MSDVHKYDNPVHENNKFGHALRLLARRLPEDAEGGVHLDLACGFGHIAEHVTADHKVEYVGVDVDLDELQALRDRGFEAHAADLQVETAAAQLREILGDRRLVSISFLDGLEHLVDGSHALSAIGELLAEHRAVAVISVPNATHYDVGLKTLMGSWTYTEAGLLDRTHFQLYSAASLEQALRCAGLHRIDADDVLLAKSDQHFPADHVGLSESTPIGQWLRNVRATAEPHAQTNQFVWALTSVPERSHQLDVREEDGPFLCILMRTQGRRPQELREALLSLAGQSSDDFEVLVIAHKTTYDEQKVVEAIIEEQPPSLRSRIRLLLLDRGRRSTPLNLGLAEARGRYIGILDDDDIVFGHWVQCFADAADERPGSLLRGIALKQDVRVWSVRGIPGIRGTDSPKPTYAADFSLAQHLYANYSPPVGWVFPRSLYLDFGQHFEESMTTTEDWEFLLRAAEIAGVTDVKRSVAIYRWWIDRESSRTLHPQDEWRQNQQEIERRIDSRPLLLPAGETRELRRVYGRLRELELQTASQAKELRRSNAKITRIETNLGKLRKARTDLRDELRAEKGRTRRLRAQVDDLSRRPSLARRVRSRLGRLRRG